MQDSSHHLEDPLNLSILETNVSHGSQHFVELLLVIMTLEGISITLVRVVVL